MKHTAVYIASFTAVLLLLPRFLVAQVSIGTPAFGSFGGGPDVVNLGNLNVHLTVPIRSKAGRGSPFSYSLTFDNLLWTPQSVNGHQTWQPTNSTKGNYWGWQGLSNSGASYISYTLTTYLNVQCGQFSSNYYNEWIFSNFVYYDQSGGHPFNVPTSYFFQNFCGNGQGPPNGQQPPIASYPASDGSGFTLANVTTGQGWVSTYVTSTNGTSLYPPIASNPSGQQGSFSSTDANGNQVTAVNGVYTDTLGKTFLTVQGTEPSNTTLTYAAPSTGNASYTVSYKSYQVITAFNCSGIAEYNTAAIYLVDKITLPDTTHYQFNYEQTPGDPNQNHVTARLASVTLPTGATITYTYTGGSNGIICADYSTAGLTRTLNGGQWSYTRTDVSGSHWQTVVTTPPDPQNTGQVGDDTVIDFQTDGSGSGNYYETQRKAYQASSTSGTLLATTIICYNGSAPPANCPTTAVSIPFSRRTVFAYLPDTTSTSLWSETDTYYQNNTTLPTEVDSYAYGTGAVGPKTRKVVTTYSTVGNATLPATVKIEDANSVVKASTTYSYDQTSVTATSGTPQHTSVTGGRGNVTTIATQVSGSLTLYKKLTYYDTGNVNTATDAGTTSSGGPNVTTYNYPDATSTCGNTFPASVTEPLSLSQSFTWDCNGGVTKSATDENGQVSTIYYTGTNFGKSADPNYWRPYAATDQLSNPTTFSYPSLTVSESTMAFNANSVVDHRVTLDVFGRPIVGQTEQGNNSTNYDSVETDYDVLGRPKKVIRPYAGTAGALCTGTCPGTAMTYDALSRPWTTTDSGTGTVNYTYTKNDVLQVVGPAPAGEQTKQKQLQYDALGRLTSVCEITSGTGSGPCNQTNPQTGFWAQYTYDLLGDMIGVSQNSQTSTFGPQTRTYAFDMIGRLTSEANPETGSVNYTYDAPTPPAVPTHLQAIWWKRKTRWEITLAINTTAGIALRVRPTRRVLMPAGLIKSTMFMIRRP